MPSAQTVDKFLEQQAKLQQPITYGRVLEEFRGLPSFDGIWRNHPLCDIFGEIDAEDDSAGRPFRTALVHVAGSVPGDGFFKMLELYRGITVSNRKQKDAVWIAELKALLAYYKPD
jgi:hypothetical protein